MIVYQKFLIKATDCFDPTAFPQLEESLQQILAKRATEPAVSSTAMIVSFIKDHCINSKLANDYPQLADQISSKGLPLNMMEELFASSRQNPTFQKDLENYIVAYLNSKNDVT